MFYKDSYFIFTFSKGLKEFDDQPEYVRLQK